MVSDSRPGTCSTADDALFQLELKEALLQKIDEVMIPKLHTLMETLDAKLDTQISKMEDKMDKKITEMIDMIRVWKMKQGTYGLVEDFQVGKIASHVLTRDLREMRGDSPAVVVEDSSLVELKCDFASDGEVPDGVSKEVDVNILTQEQLKQDVFPPAGGTCKPPPPVDFHSNTISKTCENKSQHEVMGSDFVISRRMILPTASVTTDHTFVLVRKSESLNKDRADVRAVGLECELISTVFNMANYFNSSCTQAVCQNAQEKLIVYFLPAKPPDPHLNVVKRFKGISAKLGLIEEYGRRKRLIEMLAFAQIQHVPPLEARFVFKLNDVVYGEIDKGFHGGIVDAFFKASSVVHFNVQCGETDGLLSASGGIHGLPSLWDLIDGTKLYSMKAGLFFHSLCISLKRYWLCSGFTRTGKRNEVWDPGLSSILLVLVSLQAKNLLISWQEDFRALLIICSLYRPPVDRLVSDYLEQGDKALDVFSAARNGKEHSRQWQKSIDIVLTLLGDGKSIIGVGKFGRAKNALSDLAAGMFDEKDLRINREWIYGGWIPPLNPVDMDEFILVVCQHYYVRYKGADAILLFAAFLPDHDIGYMIQIGKILILAVIIEVLDERIMVLILVHMVAHKHTSTQVEDLLIRIQMFLIWAGAYNFIKGRMFHLVVQNGSGGVPTNSKQKDPKESANGETVAKGNTSNREIEIEVDLHDGEIRKAKESNDFANRYHEDVMNIKRSLPKLHQVFLYMVVLVENQSEAVHIIEHNVMTTGSFVNGGTNSLFSANRIMKKRNKTWNWLVLEIAMIILLLIRGWLRVRGTSDKRTSIFGYGATNRKSCLLESLDTLFCLPEKMELSVI